MARPMTTSKSLCIGDYVLATKYSDGDPCDPFCLGFVKEKIKERYIVVDDKGTSFRHSGFKHAEKINKEEGEKLISYFPIISNRQGAVSLWQLLSDIREDKEICLFPNPPTLPDREQILEMIQLELEEAGSLNYPPNYFNGFCSALIMVKQFIEGKEK